MSLEKIYQLIGSIVMPFTFLLAILMMPSMMAGFGNPSILFELFVFVCLVIYVVKSVGFFRKNIQKDLPAKPSTKHMIYINGAFALLFFVQILTVFLVVYLMPDIFKDVLKTLADQVSAEMKQSFSVEQLYSTMKVFATILFIYSLLLAIHVIMSFALVKKYRNLFEV